MERSKAVCAPARSVPELFEEQARRTPYATAVSCDGVSLSFADLNARANQLGHYLAARGIGVGSRVGLRMRRSLDCIVAMLGVLKSGAAYFPLEEGQPMERLRTIAAETRLALVLTATGLGWDGADAPVTMLEPRLLNGQSTRDLRVTAGPDDAMYILYTSGSTGRPKGTEVPHRSLSGFFQGEDYARWGPGAVAVHHSALSWDGHLLDLYPALLSGGRVEIFTGDASDPVAVARYAANCGATVLWFSATAFNAVTDVDVALFSGLRDLIIGGEALSVAHVARAMSALPRTGIINGYGPSECTVFSCVYEIRPEDVTRSRIPIGREVGDRRVYLLDPAGNEITGSAVGELHIGGPGVAIGYLHRPSLTAERFVPDPFSGTQGARLYRTGDLVQRGETGLLEFIGRDDDQVKIRGFRIEPGEVSAVLRTHPDVRDAAVVPHRDEDGRYDELFAYVVPVSGRAQPQALKRFLGARLPAAMVPSAFVSLARLPLTRNGKLDRRALPSPRPDDRDTAGPAYAPPVTATEEFLVTAWEDLLKVSPIGRQHDFFVLGGQSLIAVQLMARIRRRFGAEIPARAVYESPRLADLAAVVEREAARQPHRGPAGPAPITAIPRERLRRTAPSATPTIEDPVSNTHHPGPERPTLNTWE